MALIAVALVAATPSFYGHAFINPKDSIFASGFFWALYAIVFVSERSDKSGYWTFLALGAGLGLLASIRYTAVYLLGVLAVSLIVLPALLPVRHVQEGGTLSRLWDSTKIYAGRLAMLLAAFVTAYIASMPALLINFRAGTFLDVFGQFAHYPFDGRVLYFGEYMSGSSSAVALLYGYLLVKLPLYYHLFLLTMIAGLIVAPSAMAASLKVFLRSDYQRASTAILLFVALVVPLLAFLVVHPVLYDGLRHVLFVVPLICLLLYFGFIGTVAAIPRQAATGVVPSRHRTLG